MTDGLYSRDAERACLGAALLDNSFMRSPLDCLSVPDFALSAHQELFAAMLQSHQVGAVYWAWRVYKAGPRAWTWMFVAVALLLNPFFPIRMQRAQWQPIDLCLGIFLIGWSGYWRSEEHTSELQSR